jgi:hypothetical protein
MRVGREEERIGDGCGWIMRERDIEREDMRGVDVEHERLAKNTAQKHALVSLPHRRRDPRVSHLF